MRVLALPAPIVDMKTLHAVVESIRTDLDNILDDRMPESEAPSAEPAEDTVLDALFSTTAVPPPPPRDRAKIHRFRDEDDSRARNKELNELEAAMRASLIDEKALKLRVLEVAAGASSSKILRM